MELKYILLFLDVLTLSDVSTGGPSCFSCSSIQHSSYCDYTEQCADHQVCHVTKIQTNSGHFVYTSGCINNGTCNNAKRTVGQHLPNGQVTCIDCCHGDMCNNNGCGDPGPPSRPIRGPYCFQCDHMENPSECEHLTICEIDEVCAIEEHTIGSFARQFSSGCKRKEQCEPQQILIGRDIESRRLDLCNFCCHDDFCNKFCAKQAPAISNVTWTSWGSWGACPQSGCTPTNQTRHRACIDTTTQKESNTCAGPATEARQCPSDLCEDSWESWGQWSVCPQGACVPTNQTRNRTCVNSITNHEGNTCIGSWMEIQECPHDICKAKVIFGRAKRRKRRYKARKKYREEPKDCRAIYNTGIRKNGVYRINPQTHTNITFDVYCDMDDGGWNVIQKRFDGHLNFTKRWSDYKYGFGSLESEFWLGLNNIYQLTTHNNRLVKFVLEEYSGNIMTATYQDFYISDEADHFKLHVGSFINGSIPKYSFTYNNGKMFSTYDHDKSGTCAMRRHGGWWYYNCTYLNINGKYGLMNDESGVIEHYSSYHNFRATTMKVR